MVTVTAPVDWTGRSILITGGLGFIGSNLALRLANLGAAVRVIDALVPESGGNPENLRGRSDVEVVIGDLGDAKAIASALEGVDVIFHLAAQVSHTRSMKLPLEDLDLNCRATLVLLEERRKLPQTTSLIYTGSRSQYGSVTVDPVDETQPLHPLDVNGINKASAESFVLLYDRSFGQPACSLRVGNVYGPRHQMRHAEQGFLHWFIRQAMDGETIHVFGGEQRRDFVHVDDVVDALLHAATTDRSRGETFNIGGGSSLSVREVASLVIDVVGNGHFDVTPHPPERIAIEIGSFRADIGKAARMLGWSPQVRFRDGLEETVAFYRDHRAAYW